MRMKFDSRRRVGKAAVVVMGAAVGVTLLSGCTSNDSQVASSSSSAAPSSGQVGAAAAVASPSVAKEISLKISRIDGREVLTDGAGYAVYLFTKDEGKSESACVQECAANWPALVGSVSAGEGVDPALIGSAPGTSGRQATYAGKRLYYFAKDTAVGVAKGQGLMGSWFLVGPQGQTIR